MQDLPGSFPPHAVEEVSFQSLSQAVHARRAEYVRPKHVRIKVGTWNVASLKGTDKDVGGWFVEGKGVEEALTGLEVKDQDLLHRKEVPSQSGSQDREDVASQEARYRRKETTIPKGDPGSLPGRADIGLYVLALQEVVDVNAVSEALRPYTDPSVAKKWKDALESAMPDGYTLVAEQQLIGLLLLIYASPDVATDVRGVCTTSVGTGLGGVMGNKGAVTARLVLGETTRLVFVNSHLAAGADKTSLERRNWDASQILARTRFTPVQGAMDSTQSSGEQIGDEDFGFWAGDLNYRLEGIPGDDVRRLLMLHTRNEYDLSHQSSNKIEREIERATESVKRKARASVTSSTSSLSHASTSGSSARTSIESDATAPTLVDEVQASQDPTSLQTTISSLLPHDELRQQIQARKAFHDGWREGDIHFLPTYKYDVGSVGVFDSSDKKRGPSFCDRILYRTRRDKLAYDARIKEEENAKKKDAEMQANGTDLAGSDEEILYDYDPEADGANYDYDEYDEHADVPEGVVITREGFEDEITQECYTTHQRVLSSDHKPMDAIFLLKYDAIAPELKAKVHAEVAKELDKAENETRPSVTVVVDKHHDGDTEDSDKDPANFQGVRFGDVRWGQSKHRTLTIANTGRVPASFSFIERPVGAGQDAGISPRWLKVKINGVTLSSASTSTMPIALEPGDATNVELEIRIWDMPTVQALNENLRQLEDILVLRVEGGRDHFIPVRASWQDTSLGRGVEKLIRIPEGGIRKLQRQVPKGNEDPSLRGGAGSSKLSLDAPVRFSAPRELFRLTEAIEELSTRAVAEWGMTAAADDSATAPWDGHPGWPLDEAAWSERATEEWEVGLSAACDALDSDRPLEPSLPEDLPRLQRLYVLCDLLLVFLRSLPDGVVTEALWTRIESYLDGNERNKRKPGGEEERTAIQEILAASSCHSISFVLLTSMLERLLGEVRGTDKARAEAQAGSPSRHKAGAGTLRRMTALGKLPAASQGERQQSAVEALARTLADALIRAPAVNG